MDGSTCDSCHQPTEWCVCDDPVQDQAMEDTILDAPLLELNFNDSGVRTDLPSQFEDDFERDLPELEPEDIPPDESVTDEEAEELLNQDAEYERFLNEGGFYGDDNEL